MFGRLLRALRPARPGGPSGPADIAERERYEGFELLARPVREGNVWRVAGTVRRDREGAEDHDFVRADTVASHDEAVRMCLLKARQLVDDRGDSL